MNNNMSTAQSGEHKTSKQASKSHDLASIMRLLKEYEVPSTMKPMQSVVYSTVQMFAASWLANTQTLTKYHDELSEQREYIEKLESKINKMEKQLESDHVAPPNTAVNEKINHIEASVTKLTKRIESCEESNNSKTEDYQVVHAMRPSPSTAAIVETSARLQEVVEIHGKKIRELIKRYKKDHSELIDTRNQMKQMEEQIAFLKNSNNDNTQKFKQYNQITEKLQQLQHTTTSNLEQMKEDLSGHEMEHEGIINQMISQVDNLKVHVTEMESKVGSKHRTGVNETMINNLVSKRTEKASKELHRIILTKTNKMEKLIHKVLVTQISDKNKSKKSTPRIRITSPASSKKIKNSNKNHMQPTVVHCDLNSSSSAANIAHITLDEDLNINGIAPTINDSPATRSPARSKKRRIRSTSFGAR